MNVKRLTSKVRASTLLALSKMNIHQIGVKIGFGE